jgi:hypothetical protein
MSKSTAAKVQRSTVGGVEQTAIFYDRATDTEREVPSYVVIYGSINEAAAQLGFRVLGRRETSSDVCAELHERGVSGSFWAVKS